VSNNLIAQDKIYPRAANVINVKSQVYGAKGDGVTDDTYAIQKAIDENPANDAIIYFPEGIYIVSNTLKWFKNSDVTKEERFTIFQGQNKSKVIIRLKDNCIGFQDINNPRPVIYTGDGLEQKFRNSIHDLTIDVGVGNSGAIGLRYMANNQGTISNIEIIAKNRTGSIGLDMGYDGGIGPCMVSNVKVNGFAIGIKRQWGIMITFENIQLLNQTQVGIQSSGGRSVFRKLVINNSVPAITNVWSGTTTTVLIDSEINGIGSANILDAIYTNAPLYINNVTISGYAIGVNQDNNITTCPDVPVGYIKEWTYNCSWLTTNNSPTKTLGISPKETPNLAWPDTVQWANVEDFGAIAGTSATASTIPDATEAIQRAIDSGKELVFFPGNNKVYRMDGVVLVRGRVNRIMGCEGRIVGNGTFKIIDAGTNDAPLVFIERFWNIYPETQLSIHHQTSRTVVLNSLMLNTFVADGTGDFFINDISFGNNGTLRFDGIYNYAYLKNSIQNIYCRQLNPEYTSVINEGAKLWVLGVKTEDDGKQTYFKTINNGCTEIIGHLQYTAIISTDVPMYENIESNVTCVGLSELTFGPTVRYFLKEVRNGITTYLNNNNYTANISSYNELYSCKKPIFNCREIKLKTIQSTCTNSNALNNGRIVLNQNYQDSIYYKISKGSVFNNLDYFPNSLTKINQNLILVDTLQNPIYQQTYTIRVNHNNCTYDTTVNLSEKFCNTSCDYSSYISFNESFSGFIDHSCLNSNQTTFNCGSYQWGLYAEKYHIIGANPNSYHSGWPIVYDVNSNDDNGKMYIINAGTTALNDVFYSSSNINVLPGGIYSISFWIYDLCPNCPVHPDIEFQVLDLNGRLIYNTNFNSVLANQWNNLRLKFRIPQGINTIRFKLVNKVSGGAYGNNIAMDNIELFFCSSATNVNINNNDKFENIVYPNPTSEVINFRSDNTTFLYFKIIDINGYEIVSLQPIVNSINLCDKQLPNGIYTVMIVDSGNTEIYVKRIVYLK
jgi:hypothetical protein